MNENLQDYIRQISILNDFIGHSLQYEIDLDDLNDDDKETSIGVLEDLFETMEHAVELVNLLSAYSEDESEDD